MNERTPVLINPNAPPQALEYYGGQDGEVVAVDLRGPLNREVPGMPLEDESTAPRPRYDPETGELIQPLTVKTDDSASAPPLAVGPLPVANQVIEYNRSAQALIAAPHGPGILISLCAGVNMVVLGVVFIAHILGTAVIFVGSFVPFFLVVPLGIFAALLSHYPLVLEEMGPNERDELPRPLGNMDPFDDLLFPLLRMCWSLLLCYWPLLLIVILNFRAAMRGLPLPVPSAREPLLICLLLGGLLFPAVFLTVCTSGSILNLNPARILRLMPSIGWSYLPLVLLWYMASTAYLLGTGATLYQAFSRRAGAAPELLARPYVAYPLLFLGIYLMHAFCWYLGMAYRSGHESFPWAWQVHERKTAAPIRTPRPPLPGKDQREERRKRIGVR